jgi:hypothetical protein
MWKCVSGGRKGVTGKGSSKFKVGSSGEENPGELLTAEVTEWPQRTERGAGNRVDGGMEDG